MKIRAKKNVVTPFETLAYKGETFTVTRIATFPITEYRKNVETWYDLHNERINLNVKKDNQFDNNFEVIN